MASQPIDEPEQQMDDTELVSILSQHEVQAIGYQGADNDITGEQETALAYYNGVMDDVPAQDGCSSVVDGTVALVVDNGLSALLKPFVSSDETVRFAPRGPEDVEVADQATEYINYVFNCDNPGFLILHSWFKDALLSKLGVVKAWWEDSPRIEAQQVQLTDDLQAQYVRSQPNYMGEENGVATVGQQVPDGRVKIENIPPEEFRISPAARSIETAIYTAHVPANKTRSDLIEMGFDAEIIENLPAFASANENGLRDERYRDENFTSGMGDITSHKPTDIIAVRDEYVRIDYDGDGIAELRRVIRVDNTILHNEQVDDNPFATLCPIPMPHKVFGHALADRAIQEQRIGTVLWRQALDNLYKSNNPRPVYGQGAILDDGSTADTLADNAPGAGIALKDISQFRFDAVPFVADKTYSMMELLDKKVEENTGISRAGQGLDTNALKKSGQMTATEMSLITQGKNARTEMVARIFAETGVSRLFLIILSLVSKHQPKERVIRLRNKWVSMDPRGWPEMDVAVSVGLGIGDQAERIAQADSVLGTMEQLGATPFAYMLKPKNVYNAVKRKFTAAGVKNTDEFIEEPQDGDQPQTPPDPEQQKVQAQLQLQQAQLQGQQQMDAAKLQGEQQMGALKQQLAQQEAEFEAQLAQQKFEAETALNERKQAAQEALVLRQMQLEQQAHDHRLAMSEKMTDAKISQNREGGRLDQ